MPYDSFYYALVSCIIYIYSVFVPRMGSSYFFLCCFTIYNMSPFVVNTILTLVGNKNVRALV